MERLQARYDSGNASERKAIEAHAVFPDASGGITLDEVKALEAQPIQMLIGTVVNTVLQVYSRMHCAILCTTDQIGFVTTDGPCTWYDPNAVKLRAILP